MGFHKRFILGLVGLVLVTACRQGPSENVRGKTAILSEADPGAQSPGTGDATGTDGTVDGKIDAGQQAVIVDSGNVPPLKLMAEADQADLPAGFIDDIFAIHKIEAGKTILFGKSKQSWLLDEAKDGSLVKLSVDISAPAGVTLYALENKNFWLIGKNSIAFPSTVPSTDPGQLTLINLTPDLLKDPAANVRVLFAGPQRLILATDKRANIVVLDGDKARVVALDIPKMGDVPLPISSAGLMAGADQYWFLAKDRLMLLRKGSEGQWRWFISKFKFDAKGTPPESLPDSVAMQIEAKDDKSVSYLGRTFQLMAGKLYEQNPIKLSIDGAPNPALDPEFVNQVQPLLKSACTPCHAGYEEFATVKDKAATYKQMIVDGTMPKDKVLTPAEIKILSDYLSKLIL